LVSCVLGLVGGGVFGDGCLLGEADDVQSGETGKGCQNVSDSS
jgi:hypothetical protein